MGAAMKAIGKIGERAFGGAELVPPRIPRRLIEDAYESAGWPAPEDVLSADWVSDE
jgi:hypothetical protein